MEIIILLKNSLNFKFHCLIMSTSKDVFLRSLESLYFLYHVHDNNGVAIDLYIPFVLV